MTTTSNNIELVNKANEIFKGYGITEIFKMDGEVYITSNYDLHDSMIEWIENNF